LSDTGEARYTMRVQVCSGDHMREGRPRCHRPTPPASLRRQTVPSLRRSGEGVVPSYNHSVRLYTWGMFGVRVVFPDCGCVP
jgi:hypothetical protein